MSTPNELSPALKDHQERITGTNPVRTPGVTAGDVPEGTVTEVKEWAGDDPDRQRVALEAEMEGQERVTLIDALGGNEEEE